MVNIKDNIRDRKLTCLVLILFASLFLTACGGSAPKNETKVTDNSTGPGNPPPVAPPPVAPPPVAPPPVAPPPVAPPPVESSISASVVALQESQIDTFFRDSGDTTIYPDLPTTQAAFADFINIFPHNPCQITPDSTNYGATGMDPLRPFQWYLDAAKIPQAWDEVNESDTGYQGEGIIVQINDSALQNDHEDLAENVIPGLNAYVPEDHPNRTNPYHNILQGFDDECINGAHGTAVAGIIAAVGGNSRGMIGVAPKAKITTTNMVMLPFLARLPTKPIIDSFTHNLTDVAISSNSWGHDSLTRLYNARPEFNGLIDNGILRGFGGKGISYFFAAGNAAFIGEVNRTEDGDPQIRDLNLYYPETSNMPTYFSVLNHPGVMPICAVGVDNRRAPYSERGGNLWVCGYSNARRDVPLNISSATDPAGRQAAIANHITNASANNDIALLGMPTTDLSLSGGYNRLPRDDGSFDENIDIEYSDDCNTLTYRDMPADFSATNVSVMDGNPANCDGDETSNRSIVELTWPAGATASYTRFFGGTSAAAPLVAGVGALIRAVNQDLTWRDVKVILADSAEAPPARTDGSCNGAPKYSDPDENYCHDSDYGFGIVNAQKAVRLAKGDWQSLNASKPFVKQTYPADGLIDAVAGEGQNSHSANISGEDNIAFIEHVQLYIESDFSNFGQLEIELERGGQSSLLSSAHSCLEFNVVEIPPLLIQHLIRVNSAGEYVNQSTEEGVDPKTLGIVLDGSTDVPDEFIAHYDVVKNSDGSFSDMDGNLIEKEDTDDMPFAVFNFIVDMKRERTLANATSDCPDLKDGFTFGAASFLGMPVNGDWELRVTAGNRRVPVKWRLIFYGHK